MQLELDVERWARQQFGDCELGDARRVERAVQFAAQIAAAPDAHTPTQTEEWADLKAAYRLIDSPHVSFQALAEPHWKLTCASARGVCLILGDTTEVDFGPRRKIKGAGPLGIGSGQGFLLHSGLLVDAKTEQVLGLAGQVLRYRQPAPAGEHWYESLQRSRESEMWGQVVDQVGIPPADTQFIHIFDRGGDNFEVFGRLLLCRCDWVIRAAHLNRLASWVDGAGDLADYLQSLPLAGTYELPVRAQKQQPARTAKLEVRYGNVLLPAPRHRSPWLKGTGLESLTVNVVEVSEREPPAGVQPLRWVLLTSLPVASFEDAWQVIEYYEKRPIIEEFHKALKTGCRAEERQYRTGKRLEAIIGLLSVVAIRLLQLRSIARQEPERRATEVVPTRWVKALQQLRPKRHIGTVREFFRGLAGLGGFLGRKGDGEPGWMTLWRGYEKLHLALRALHHQEH
jgi:hypothetical protein